MKKKGLIIATIVMVLVLAVSLTTATYAWFTTSAVTKIDPFTVSVASTNAVNIGIKASPTISTAESLSTADFVSGDCTYTSGTAGIIETNGSWSGTIESLSNSVTPNILWGAQTKAVAALNSSESSNPLSTVSGNYGSIGTKDASRSGSETTYINAANLDAGTTLTNVAAAKANKGALKSGSTDEYENGDYVHMILGVQPTKALDKNSIVIMMDWSSSTKGTLGILAGLHVAYRTRIGTSSISSWTDVCILDAAVAAGDYTASTPATVTQASPKNSINTNIVDGSSVGDLQLRSTYASTYQAWTAAQDTTTYALVLDNLSTTQGTIDQIELIIYLDGSDGDMINAGLGATCQINIFFCSDVKKA